VGVGVGVGVGAAASCVTLNVLPAMVIVPVRSAAFGLAATVKLTVPLPLPLAPELTVMNGELLTAVHVDDGQLPVKATLTMPVLPEAPKFWLDGLMPKLYTPSVAGIENSPPHELETKTS
jgi:hypothetical protein